MEKIFELEVCSRPGRLLDIDYGKKIEKEIVTKLSLDTGVFVGLSNIAGQVDINNLRSAILDGELTLEGFRKFCSEYGFVPEVDHANSACKYLEYEYGVEIAWLHLPHTSKGISILETILVWANNNGFNIQCGDLVYCINPHVRPLEPLGW